MFVLKKDWRDFAPNIEMVQIHFTWALRGQQPDWERIEETRTLRVVPDTVPPYRVCGIELPNEVEGSDQYDLHYSFVYVQGGREQFLPPVKEEIANQEIRYEDLKGKYTLVGIRWAAGDWTFSNYTLLNLEGLGLDLAQNQSPYSPSNLEPTGIEFPQIYEFVKSRPLPHVFCGKVHGPRGTLVAYQLHLLTRGGPGTDRDTEVWDTNGNRGWLVTIL